MKEGWLFHRIFFNILVLFSLGAEIGCGGGGGGSSDPSTGSAQVPLVSLVFVLVEENHSYNSVIANSARPYTNGLAQRYALATQYYANTHNSLPNYFMLTVGNLITTNDLYTETVTADNVVRALTNAGKSWKMYLESLPNAAYLGASLVPYAKDHDPFAYFSDVLNSSTQAANIVPITQLATDIQNGTLPTMQ